MPAKKATSKAKTPAKKSPARSSSAKKTASRTASGKASSSPRAGTGRAESKSGLSLGVRVFICLLLFVVSAFAAFLPGDGVLTGGMHSVLFGLLGGGAYFLPPAMLAALICLILTKDGSCRRTVWLLAAVPFLAGMCWHLVIGGQTYITEPLRLLYEEGNALRSGGVIAGGIAELLEKALSSAGAIVIVLVLCVAELFLLFRVRPIDLIRLYRERRGETADEEEPSDGEAAESVPMRQATLRETVPFAGYTEHRRVMQEQKAARRTADSQAEAARAAAKKAEAELASAQWAAQQRALEEEAARRAALHTPRAMDDPFSGSDYSLPLGEAAGAERKPSGEGPAPIESFGAGLPLAEAAAAPKKKSGRRKKAGEPVPAVPDAIPEFPDAPAVSGEPLPLFDPGLPPEQTPMPQPEPVAEPEPEPVPAQPDPSDPDSSFWPGTLRTGLGTPVSPAAAEDEPVIPVPGLGKSPSPDAALADVPAQDIPLFSGQEDTAEESPAGTVPVMPVFEPEPFDDEDEDADDIAPFPGDEDAPEEPEVYDGRQDPGYLTEDDFSLPAKPHGASPAPAIVDTHQQAPEEKPALEATVRSGETVDEGSAPPYTFPPIELLHEDIQTHSEDATEELKMRSAKLRDTLESFGVAAQIVNVIRGPSVTRYELVLASGVKLSRLTGLQDDIALALGASGVRIAPIPDKSLVGIEVPNKVTQTVFLRGVLESGAMAGMKSRLGVALGKDITGECLCADIQKMPHLLIAGTTGSGKSVCINAFIISMLYRATPEEVRMIMIDPKMVELGDYNGIPHLLIPVVTDYRKAAGALAWAVNEMEQRYKLLAAAGAREISAYNRIMEAKGREKLPQVVIVIDELADLMMVAAKEIEESICRIAQKARAAGMHLIIATQRPSADVLTGLMKSNIPSRIAFAVQSQIESRIILDTGGADKLIGRGDMLFLPLGAGKPRRIQGCFVTDEEIEAITEFVKCHGEAQYDQDVLDAIERAAQGDTKEAIDDDEADPMLGDAVDVIMDCGQASASMLQRRLKLGYARASRIIDQMEARGIVGPFDGSRPRQIMISKTEWQEMKLRGGLRT